MGIIEIQYKNEVIVEGLDILRKIFEERQPGATVHITLMDGKEVSIIVDVEKLLRDATKVIREKQN